MLDFKGFASKILKEKKYRTHLLTSFGLNSWPQVYTSIAIWWILLTIQFYLQIFFSKSVACSPSALQATFSYCKGCLSYREKRPQCCDLFIQRVKTLNPHNSKVVWSLDEVSKFVCTGQWPHPVGKVCKGFEDVTFLFYWPETWFYPHTCTHIHTHAHTHTHAHIHMHTYTHIHTHMHTHTHTCTHTHTYMKCTALLTGIPQRALGIPQVWSYLQ